MGHPIGLLLEAHKELIAHDSRTFWPPLLPTGSHLLQPSWKLQSSSELPVADPGTTSPPAMVGQRMKASGLQLHLACVEGCWFTRGWGHWWLLPAQYIQNESCPLSRLWKSGPLSPPGLNGQSFPLNNLQCLPGDSSLHIPPKSSILNIIGRRR